MSKIMLINVTHAEESRVGIVEDGQLESFEIESFSREHLKGNIYKGIVRRIHPAIEAAFVDIGAERDAFLPLDEICFRNLPAGRDSGSGEKGRRRIKEVLKSGDEILVQIIKEQFTNKPPTLSTFYSLPGRYLVLLPGSEDAGISRKIEGEDRVRLREMISGLHPPAGCGIIVRTAAGFDEEQGELERDLGYLTRLWDSIVKHAETRRAPAVIYREHDLVLRNIRDYFTPDINEIFIDNEEVYERAKEFLLNVMPGKEHLLHLYQGARPIFSHFGLEAQIESIYKRRVELKSGGSIVIDGTEALTAIDVNSGGSMRSASQEETAYKTNLEAAREIARQLRLRDLGGIIVIDFIDMREQKHIGEVERALRDAMRAEKARHDTGRISRLGLLEISRQRLRPTAASSSYTACPMCEGHGSVRTTESAALVALRKIHHRVAEGDIAQMKVGLPRDVAMYLLNQKRDDLAILETRYAARIQVVVNDKLMPHQSEIETRTRDVAATIPAMRSGEGAAAAAPLGNGAAQRRPAPASGLAAVAPGEMRRPSGLVVGGPGSAQTSETRARARRRRGGRGRRVEGEASAADEASSMHAVSVEHAAEPEPVPVRSSVGVPEEVFHAGEVENEPVGTESPSAHAPTRLHVEAETSPAAAEVAPVESVTSTTMEEPLPPDPSPPNAPEAPALALPDEPILALQRMDECPPGMSPEPADDPCLDAANEERVTGDRDRGGEAAVTMPGARRRHRRGGRRGGRGRGATTEQGPAVLLDAAEEPLGEAEQIAPAESAAEGLEGAQRPQGHRRRRRGGRRRRSHSSPVAPNGPAEPPVES